MAEKDIELFKKSVEAMVAKNGRSWDDFGSAWRRRHFSKEYTKEEVEQILNSNSLIEMQKVSRSFFYRDGLYKRILIYYATLLKYVGILIPNPSAGNELSTPYVKKKYDNALDYLDKMDIQNNLTRFSLGALIDGCYYGVLQKVDKTDFVLLDLPFDFCRSNYKDLYGNDIIEFNVQYFDSIIEESSRKQALKVYPKVISDHYNRYHRGSTNK